MSSAVSNGLGFASYETGLSCYRHVNGGMSPNPAERGVIAGFAATVVMAAVQPLEVIMRRMQVCIPLSLGTAASQSHPSPEYLTLQRVDIQLIYRRVSEGPGNCLACSGPYVIK